MKRFKAVLFDFDGVIVHSTPVHLDGWDRAFFAVFNKTIEPDLLSTLVGQSTAAIGELLANHGGASDSKKDLIKRKAKYVLDNLASIPLIPGIADFFVKLEAAGIPYGIASNAPRAFLAAALAKHELPHSFYFGLEDYVRPKPDPEPYLKGASHWQWHPDDHRSIAVFEDSTHGIEAAVKAGMTAIGVCSQHEPDILLAAGAWECIKDFEDHDFLNRNFFKDS